MQKYNVLIIGAGKIAGGFDTPGSDVFLTHAHAYQKHEAFNLLGFYDVDFSKAKEMAQKWSVSFFENLKGINADIISVCTPDEVHLSSLKEALKLNPKLIFLEKPLSKDLKDSKEILEISKNIPVLVNYSRRFIPEFQDLSINIKKGAFGEYFAGNGFYGKGFIHNGSHMIDLLHLLVGKTFKMDVIDGFIDFYSDDSTKTAILSFQSDKKFFMQGVDCNNFTIFELDLIFEKARIRILDSGLKIEIYNIIEDTIFKGYRKLELKEEFNTKSNKAMFYAVDNIYNFLNYAEPLKCSIEQAFEAIKHG